LLQLLGVIIQDPLKSVNPLRQTLQVYKGPQDLHPFKQGKQLWLIFVKPSGHMFIQNPWYKIKDDEQDKHVDRLVQDEQLNGHYVQLFVNISRKRPVGHEFVHIVLLF